MFRHILVGLDGSEAGRRALHHAIALTTLTGATLHGLCIEEQLPAYAATVGEFEEEVRVHGQYCQRILLDAEQAAREAGIAFETEIAAGHVAQVLVRTAHARAIDLIVLGKSGHSRVHQIVFGSTTDRVVEHAPCAVLVIP